MRVKPGRSLAHHRRLSPSGEPRRYLASPLGWDGTSSLGERWLDRKVRREARIQGDIAIIPTGISHRCNWNAPAQFMILAIEPALLKQVGEDWVNPERIELIPHFMTEQDALIQGIFWALREELESGKIGGYLLIDSLKTTLAIHLLRNYCTTHNSGNADSKRAMHPRGTTKAIAIIY